MATVLVVTNPFNGLARGQRITDPDEMEEVLEGEHAQHVVRAEHADVSPATRNQQE